MALPDIANYYLFAKAVRCGSINAASRELELPKSTISRRISQLETEQGVRLVHRGRQGLRLTDVGEAFLVHCDALVDAADSATQVTQHLLAKPRGRVNVSSPYAISQSLLTQVLPEFMTRYPEIQLNLMVTNRPVNLLDENIDLALRVRPSIEDSSLIARPISDAPQTLFAAPKLIGDSIIAEPTDLLHYPQLSLHYTSGRYGYVLTHQSGNRTQLQFEPRLISDDMILLREAAIEGQGVVALPNYLCQQAVAEGRLQQLLPDWNLPVGIMHMTYPHRRGLKPAVRVLIDYLAEKLPKVAERAF
ncbi:MAG: LysR family transcriptional regulator [Idiomarina sp.]|jgi:DNA-binding transcriptional LysR family regulator|uniref:LysR family transcriptional regulator n=1 Tax=Idiomarina aquatica TaxID=1327752 RepID=A0A4R6PPR5_9GAMM|nr:MULTISPECIES: LysR substrate-binding domain-containing protein [Idiomarina]MAK70526.1 LysR family transcriptional regulator [Idiomarinaceae bacterium]MBL4741597.1 LysR family transcriptional regulator [Idiomarina sp.]MBT41703.1 LysR family transcriptional regulator [Idiomarina sp.]PHQ77779.1 MAG: LysR family transcriptional regulator [Idiomarina sp.]TDP40705.1 LysR family transcriptional regulator [Idiomarina aquatica]